MITSRHLLRALAASFALVAVFALTAAAAPPKGAKPGAPGAEAADKGDKPYGEWKKLIRDTDVQKGFFTVYRKRENVYLEIQPSQFNMPFLGVFSLASGIGTNFVLGGLPLNDHLLEFERAGDRVLVIEKNIRFTAPDGSPMKKAVELSYGSSVIASLKVESVNDSSRAVLVDFAKFLVSDAGDLAENLRQALDKSVRFDGERSTVTRTKMFPENFEAEALLTYSPNDRTNFGLEGVSDDRFIPIGVHYSFSKLPERPMTPRLADERVGYFLTAQKNFGRDTQENFWVRYVNRWRLEKQDPSAALSEPVKPIVYYVDRTVPQEYRAAVKEGIEKWQKAFEAAGFKNAIIAKDAPDDSSWDAEDVRYSTIRWITSTQPVFGAIGPSRVDPRTGEILDADVLVEASMIQGFRSAYRRFSGPDQMAAEILPETRLQQAPAWLSADRMCDAEGAAADGLALMHMTWLMDGVLPPGSPVPEDYMHDAIVWVVMHEVGHTLGLRHNFRSSTSTPYDKLNDKAWVAEHGLYSSVMEYPSPNISLDRAKQGFYYTQGAGTEDLWRIRYGYTPFGGDEWAEAGPAKQIADESLQPGHEYSSDDDTYPANACDPRSNIYDLGDDPLRFAKDRSAYLSGLWKNPKFEERILGSEATYPVLRRAVNTLFQQYGISLGMAVKFVGGSYASRVRRGQPGAKDPLELVPAAKTREALDFLGQRAFAADAFTLAPAVLNRMPNDHWAHWGMAGFGDREDYPLGDVSLAIQKALLNGLLSPALLARLHESESRGADAFRTSEFFDRMTRMLWGEVGGGAASAAAFKALEGPNTRRDVQRAYVDKLATMVVTPPPGAPDDARALARLQLSRVDARCARVLASEAPMGDNVRAHLMETRARIKRALEAGREADVATAPGRPGGTAAPVQH